MESTITWWRKVLALDLTLTLLAVFTFAWIPPDTLNGVELSIMITCLFAIAGIISHVFGRGKWKLPLDEWSYAAAGSICFGTAIIFSIWAYLSDITWQNVIPAVMFLIAGTASGAAGHVIDGGVRRQFHDNG